MEFANMNFEKLKWGLTWNSVGKLQSQFAHWTMCVIEYVIPFLI